MRYVIGVDGGQTSTTAVIADETGCLLGIGHGGPANHIHEPGGVERVRRSLSDAVREAIVTADLQNARIAAACLGMTGSSDEMERICAPVVPTDHLIFGQDTRIALYSVTFGRSGVVIIAGTGAAAYGVSPQGGQAHSGGWGHMLGDEGSGYWIAVRALNACCRACDGIDPPTQMLPLLLKRLEATDLKEVHALIYGGRLPRPDLAALAETVALAAAQGDATARRILREAGKELAVCVIAVIRKLQMQQEPALVGTVGGVFRAGRAVLRPFREAVKLAAPHASVVGPRVPPAVAAALMALEAISVSVQDGLIANVETALARLGPVKA